MSKSIEEELGVPFAQIDKALERLEKTYAKFIHGMSQEQKDATIGVLQERVGASVAAMMVASRKAVPFSFSAAQQPRAAVYHHNEEASRPRPPVKPVEQLPPRPIGRLVKDADEPGAGEPVFGQPIKPARPMRNDGDGTVGFLSQNDRGEDVLV